jgi:hypothetical protein
VQRQTGCAQCADLCVGVDVLGVVAMVQDEGPLSEEEEDEAAPDEEAEQLGIVERRRGLGEDLEERDRHDDAAGERDHRRQVAREPKRDEAAGQRREDGQPGEGNRQRHAQLLQVP